MRHLAIIGFAVLFLSGCNGPKQLKIGDCFFMPDIGARFHFKVTKMYKYGVEVSQLGVENPNRYYIAFSSLQDNFNRTDCEFFIQDNRVTK